MPTSRAKAARLFAFRPPLVDDDATVGSAPEHNLAARAYSQVVANRLGIVTWPLAGDLGLSW